jgi:hypothetical protein
MMILYDNIVNDATITYLNQNSSYPWTNLIDPRLSRKGSFLGRTGVWLQFDFDQYKTVDTIAIVGNISRGALIEFNSEYLYEGEDFGITEGAYISTRRANNKIYKYHLRGYVGMDDIELYGTVYYRDYTFSVGAGNYKHSSFYDSYIIDLEDDYHIVWEAFGSVLIQFRDSDDGYTWTARTAEVDATSLYQRDKVKRYMQFRLIFNSPDWTDTTSYFQLLEPLQEEREIFIFKPTETTAKTFRITIYDPYNENLYIEISKIFLGKSLIAPGMDPSKIITRKTNSEYSKSLTGQMYGKKGAKLKYAEIPFKGVDTIDKLKMQRFNDTVDVTTPFFLMIWEDNLNVEPPIYCNLIEPINFQKENSNDWSFTIKIEECR